MISNAPVFRAPRHRPHHSGRIAHLLIPLLAVLLTLTTTACVSLPDAATEAPEARASQDLVPVDTGGHGILLVRPDHQLGRYDELLIERVGFRYSDHQRFLSRRDEDRISAMLTSAVQGSHDGAVGLASDAGPCVLSVEFYVTDLELYDPEDVTGSSVSIVRSFGEATMVMELRDSETERPLARFLQKRELGGGTSHGGSGASIRRLGDVVGAAMRDMGNEIRKLTPPTSSGWDGECRGGMTRVAFGSH